MSLFSGLDSLAQLSNWCARRFEGAGDRSHDVERCPVLVQITDLTPQSEPEARDLLHLDPLPANRLC